MIISLSDMLMKRRGISDTENSDNALNDYTCDYVVYDDREKKAVYHFTVGGYYDPVSESQPFDSDVKYSEGMFSFFCVELLCRYR